MTSREATSTIKGYYYQFDQSILQILRASEDAEITVEGIEDIDIKDLEELEVIQCKYYEKTKYNHSVIAKPIRQMLRHYSINKNKDITYKLYGHYQKGQEKLLTPIDIDFVKEKFLTYTKDKVPHNYHEELGLEEGDLKKFLSKLTIDINAISYDEQNIQILESIKECFTCNDIEAEHYYNNALRIILDLAVEQDSSKRKITKKIFLKKINNRKELFNMWYLKSRDINKYCEVIKKKYFSQFNISNFARFFLLECDPSKSIVEIKTLILDVSEKYSNKKSRRNPDKFCPYFFIKGISEAELIELKKLMYRDNIKLLDGYPFKGANFSAKHITQLPDETNKVRLKILNELDFLPETLNEIEKTREIYQFYIKEPFYENTDHKHIKIPVKSIENVHQILN